MLRTFLAIAALAVLSGQSLAATPAFSVHKNGTDQTVAQDADVKLTWSTESFDTNNNFAADRFTPTVAGKYLFVVSAQCVQSGACMPAIAKNGSIIARSANTNVNVGQTPQVTAIVDLNGTTDYVEAFINGAGSVIKGDAARTYFSGSQVDGAGSGGGGGSSQWTTTGSDIHYATGGVAIGQATAPEASALLELESTTKGFLLPRLTTTQVNAVSSPSDGLVVYDTDTDTLKLRANGGWVSVGSSMLSGWPDAIKCSGTGFTGDTYLYLAQNAGASSNKYYAFPYSAADARIYFTSSGAYSGTTGGIGAGDCNVPIATLYSQGRAFNFGSSGSGSSQWTTTGSDIYYNTGNVGIGTVAPITKLSVAGSQGLLSRIESPNNAAFVYVDDAKGTFTGSANTATFGSSRLGSGTLPKLRLAGQGGLEFAVDANSVRMSIDSSGNVGIGTTTPSTKLHILGGRIAIDNVVAGQAGLQFSSAGAESAVMYRPSNSVDLHLWGTAYGGDVMTWNTTTGNVGIGTTTPGAKLDVGGVGAASTLRVNRFFLNDDNVNASLSNNSAGAFLLYNNVGTSSAAVAYRFHATSSSTAVLDILSNGNVGIGTTSPSRKLDVNGSTATTTLFVNNQQVGGIVNATAQAANATNHDFNGVPSYVKRITVMFNGVSTNAAQNILIQIGTSSGLETTGYASAASTASGAAINSSVGFIVTNGNSVADTVHGMVTLQRVDGNTWVSTGLLGLGNSAALRYSGGSKTLGGTLDRLRVTTTNGTTLYDAGTINISYE